jgi:hypothetical protein
MVPGFAEYLRGGSAHILMMCLNLIAWHDAIVHVQFHTLDRGLATKSLQQQQA